jgi:hypothetical protein
MAFLCMRKSGRLVGALEDTELSGIPRDCQEIRATPVIKTIIDQALNRLRRINSWISWLSR